jgi:hypothetical protein
MNVQISMLKKRLAIAALLAVATLIFTISAPAKKGRKVHKPDENITSQGKALLWRTPKDLRSRDLFYGPGGKDHAPRSTYTFTKEVLHGTNPKFDVRDENGVKWRVKLGIEARPEVVATRLVWAVGYSTNEDYFLPQIHVENMPARLRRGQNLAGFGGNVPNVCLKRYSKREKKVGTWHWRGNPFAGTRELNGLRVMMALINNWDLTDDNNSVYLEKHPEPPEGPEEIYEVSDLGASFGATGRSWPRTKAKGNLESYRHSRFITKVTPEYVDFNVPTRPALIFFFSLPEFISRLQLRWIGKRIPRADARWVGQLLAQLSPAQIRDAFRAAGYTPDQVEGFARVVEARIAMLNKL